MDRSAFVAVADCCVHDSIERRRPVLRPDKIQCYRDRPGIVVDSLWCRNVIDGDDCGGVVAVKWPLPLAPLCASVAVDGSYEMYAFCGAVAY